MHLIQAQLARGRIGASWETEPAWLIEGAAEYVSARYRDAMSYKSYRYFMEDAIDIARERRVTLPLQRLVSREDFRGLDIVYAYSFSFLAAEWLAAHAGDAALFRYMRQLSRAGTNWDLAFEIAFGLRVEEFYNASRNTPRTLRSRGRIALPGRCWTIPVALFRISRFTPIPRQEAGVVMRKPMQLETSLSPSAREPTAWEYTAKRVARFTDTSSMAETLFRGLPLLGSMQGRAIRSSAESGCQAQHRICADGQPVVRLKGASRFEEES